MIEDATQGMHANRRRSFRAEVQGNAIVHGPGDAAVRCAVIDLSLGGVRLLEPVRDEPGLDPGTEVTIELECSGAGWVVQRGRIARHRLGELVVCFDALSPEVEDLIEDEVLGAVEAQKAPRVVVVDRAHARRRHVSDALRTAGSCVLEASTPLEAIALIERSRNHVCAVALSESLTQTQADEVRRFLQEEHPHVKVVVITIHGDGDAVHAGPVRELIEHVRGIGRV